VDRRRQADDRGSHALPGPGDQRVLGIHPPAAGHGVVFAERLRKAAQPAEMGQPARPRPRSHRDHPSTTARLPSQSTAVEAETVKARPFRTRLIGDVIGMASLML